MVILVPVIAGDSTIPKWVLARVTSSRDRKGITKELVFQCLYIFSFSGFIAWSSFSRMSEQERQKVLTDPLNLVLAALFFVLVFMSLLPIFRARKWLDDHQKWPEVALLEWQEPPKSPNLRNPFAPRVKGETSIPKWVLARVTSSLDRQSLSLEIRRLWVLLVLFGLLLLLPCVTIVFLLVFSQFDVWLAIAVILPSLLWWIGFWQVSMGQRARTWLDRNEKWAEVAKLEWVGEKPQTKQEVAFGMVALVACFLVVICLLLLRFAG
jgi:Ca2+/Na+ antiporter